MWALTQNLVWIGILKNNQSLNLLVTSTMQKYNCGNWLQKLKQKLMLFISLNLPYLLY